MLAPSQLEHYVNKFVYEFLLSVLGGGDSKPICVPKCVVVHQLLL